jgi:hypothetical protein
MFSLGAFAEDGEHQLLFPRRTSIVTLHAVQDFTPLAAPVCSANCALMQMVNCSFSSMTLTTPLLMTKMMIMLVN